MLLILGRFASHARRHGSVRLTARVCNSGPARVAHEKRAGMSAPSLLAIEPRRETASALRGLVDERVDGRLTVVESVDQAVAAINRQVPELILVSPLLAPKDEAELFARLRALPNGRFVQTLITPFLAPADPPARRLFGFRSARKAVAGAPSEFADHPRSLDHAPG